MYYLEHKITQHTDKHSCSRSHTGTTQTTAHNRHRNLAIELYAKLTQSIPCLLIAIQR